MLNKILDTLFNGVLVGTSGYAMFELNPVKRPFAFTASAVGFCHGCMGIYLTYFETKEEAEKKPVTEVQKIVTSCMEIITVPLVNIDVYRCSQQSDVLAFGHGLFIVPLACDLAYRYFAKNGEESQYTEVLKNLTIAGNIVSLMFFAANENNPPAGVMALAASFAYYGSIMMEKVLEGTKKNASLAGNSLFFGLLPISVGAIGSKSN